MNKLATLTILLVLIGALTTTAEESVLLDLDRCSMTAGNWTSEQYLQTERDYGAPTRDPSIAVQAFSGADDLLNLRGALTTSYPEVIIYPNIEKPGDQSVSGCGVIRNVGAIKQVSMNICCMSEPAAVSLVMSDELDNIFSVGFEVNTPQGAWYTLSFENPTYWLERRFPEFRIPELTLIEIRVSSPTVLAYWNKRADETALMTEAERVHYVKTHPVESVSQNFDLLIKDISIVHGEVIW